jgi:hypothetical protein
MKLKPFIALVAFSIFVACNTPYRATDTTTTTSTTVVAPMSTQTVFTTQYPNASNVTWSHYDPNVIIPIDWDLNGWTTLDQNDYVVRFDMNSDNYYAWYDENGNWVGTVYTIRDNSTLPTTITNVVNNQFQGYTITSVNREFQKDRMAYEVELKNSTSKIKVLIDDNGNIIKQKTKTL